MSLLNYFKSANKTKAASAIQSMENGQHVPANISNNELLKVKESLQVVDGRKPYKRTTYKETEKPEIARYAMMSGATAAVRKFRTKFPCLTEGTVRPWVTSYRKSLQEQRKKNSNDIALKIGKPRGRPLLLEEELDHKLRSMLTSLRLAGAGINIHVIRGVLNGLVRANPVKYGKYVEFNVTRSWTRSLYQRMKFSRRAVTTSRPIITRSLWTEVRSQYLFEIIDKALTHDIPDELIINVDQTPSKFVATDNVTMAAKGEKHISRAGASDKRAITVTLGETLDGHILPFQLIYTGKTQRSLPSVKFPEGFCLAYNPKHWSNEKETLRLIDEVLVPYISKVKEAKSLPATQRSLLLWDAFKAQSTEVVKESLRINRIEVVTVPKNMTHLLQPLDLTTNATFKKFEKRAFSEYFTSCIMKALEVEPDRDVTSVEVDLRLSILKPRHAKVMIELYNYLKTEDGRKIIESGWKAAGIKDNLEQARQSKKNPFKTNPFV